CMCDENPHRTVNELNTDIYAEQLTDGGKKHRAHQPNGPDGEQAPGHKTHQQPDYKQAKQTHNITAAQLIKG
ncbi:hypothetical protein, partial [Erwinia amylovora]|uniref:hypothetical protein n=1 Tax=Erwinia amylovora TaxID=552 RepID=UPI0020BFD258